MNIAISTMTAGKDEQELVLSTQHVRLAMLREGELPGSSLIKYELSTMFDDKVWELERDEYMRVKNAMLNERMPIWPIDRID
jgi:hypothetical protein